MSQRNHNQRNHNQGNHNQGPQKESTRGVGNSRPGQHLLTASLDKEVAYPLIGVVTPAAGLPDWLLERASTKTASFS